MHHPWFLSSPNIIGYHRVDKKKHFQLSVYTITRWGIDKLEGSSSLRLPVDDIPIHKSGPDIQSDGLEMCPTMRYSNYQKLVKKRWKEV